MGSYPALDIKAPQQPDLLEKYGQLQQLKALQQQQQMQQEEAPLRQQILQQQVQTGQQDAAARQALNAAYSGAVTKDENGNPAFDETKLAQGLANGPAAYKTPEVMKSLTDFHKEKVELQTSVTDLRAKQDKMIGSAASAVKAANYDPTLAHSILDSLPPSPQIEQIRQQIDNPQALKQLIDGAIQNSPEQRQLGIEQSKADQQAANQDATRQQAAANAQETAKYHAQEVGLRKQGLSMEGARLAFEKSRQGTADQQAIESQAQQIANGDVKALSLSRNNPMSRAVMARVYEINPKYSDSLYTATQDLRSSKPNSMGGNVGRLGTAILHADEALKSSGGLGFSEGLLTGVATPGTAAYRQSAEFLTGEIGQYVEGGKLTNGQGDDLKKDLFSSRQAVRDSAIKKIIDLSGGKLKSQMEQFKNATQTDFPTDRVFNDSGIKGALEKHGVIGGATSGSVTMKAPNGQTKTVPADQVEHYKAQGATVVQ